jgi:hypothetical protein
MLRASMRLLLAAAVFLSAALLFWVGSQWVVLASRSADLGAIADNENWRPLLADPSVGLWTDDYSNLLAILHPWSATP